MSKSIEDLKNIRSKIDEIDEKLISLMAKRTNFATEIALLKVELNMPVNDEKREREIRERICKLCEKYNFDCDLALKIIEMLVEYNKKIQIKEISLKK
ncbi:MAG TPA: hypothetical protein EYG76_01200 [Methanothermococcus okinawensis]|uniref:Chorismate mutase domain-containing protein n=1 Tax=Methanothermococcus okinawensis TaxID=155863 RepID=A0A832YSZ4_9EURY|nr:hypothetical protein [Methanothermococcus okinawensis]